MKVLIVAVVSADGYMAQDPTQRSVNWRSKEDGQLFSELTRKAGVVVMGSTTFKTFKLKRGLPGRRTIIYTHHPESIVGEGIKTTDDSPNALVCRLADEGYTELAVCGGASINKLFMDSGLVTDLYVTIEPVLFGSGVPLFSGPVVGELTLQKNRQLNDNTVLLHYTVNK